MNNKYEYQNSKSEINSKSLNTKHQRFWSFDNLNFDTVSKFGLRNSNFQIGQVVLLLVLITVVGLTIGLSLISRTVTDIRMSSQIEQSSRAFSAAESGVESALQSISVGVANPTGTVNLTGSGAVANYTVSTLGGTDAVYTIPLTEVEQTQTVWLVDHDSNGKLQDTGSSTNTYPATSSLDICWGSDPNSKPALKAGIIYKDNPSSSGYKIAYRAYDVDPTRGNNFITANVENLSNQYCNGRYHYRKSLSSIAGEFGIADTSYLIALRLSPSFANSAIALKPSTVLPIQGNLISSVGQTSTSVVRKIQVVSGYKTLPSLLDFALFSEN